MTDKAQDWLVWLADHDGIAVTFHAEAGRRFRKDFEALLAERDEALSSLEELAESAERYRQAVDGRVAVLVAALREIQTLCEISGLDTLTSRIVNRVLAGGEATGQEETMPWDDDPSRVVVEGE